MLSGLRTAQQGWLGKIIVAVLFGFLILSFGIWGIGDIFRIAHRETIATVGSREITAVDYRYTFQNELLRLSQQSRRNITAAEAFAAGIDRQVLATMMADAALDQKARQLGLALSDKTITQAIYADPAFRGPDGQFNPQLFVERLRQSGYTEQSFLAEQRGFYLRRQIAEGFAGAPAVPTLMLDALHRFSAETRSIDSITLGASAVAEIAAPDDATLQSFYDARKSEFASPEFRSLVLLPLDPAMIAKPDSIPEADVRAEYERLKASRFTTPEKRGIERIPFKDRAAADAAEVKIKEGASFDEIAKEMGLAPEDLSIGSAMTKEVIADPALAEAAFSLPQGTPSGIIETKFGPVIARVTAIEPGKVKPFEEAQAQLRQDMATARAKTGLRDLRDKIEDQRASAKPIAEIAAALNLPFIKIDAVDATGNGKDGNPVAGIPDKDVVLKAAFQAEVGSDNDAVSLRDGGYVWYDVTGIERARDRPLAEVRDKAAQAWTDDQRSLALARKAAELAKRLDAGTPIADLAKEENVEVNSVEDITRASKPPGLSPAALNAIFSVKSGAAGYALGADGLSRVVFKVKSASLPPPDPIAAASLRPRLATALEDDMMQSYVQQLQKELGTTVDEAAMRATLRGSGGDTGDQ
jgi:peptidyl-prolyl cis-trans isomerase D